jgi:hypothetical protein
MDDSVVPGSGFDRKLMIPLWKGTVRGHLWRILTKKNFLREERLDLGPENQNF